MRVFAGTPAALRRRMRAATLALLLALPACASNALPFEEGPARPPDAGSPDTTTPAPTACGALDPCDCMKRPDCQPIAENCFCPYPTCGPGACFCGGGRFLGCAPTTSGCAPTVTCRPAGRAAGPDARGCFA